MTELLIILVPYLLLTSGLAQLSQLNVTGMLADVAVYDAARTVWLWAPEVNTARGGQASDATVNANSNDVRERIQYRARSVAASILAPTGPGNYNIGQIVPSPYPMTDHRSVMTGMFLPSNDSQHHWDFTTGHIAFNGGTFSIDGSGNVIPSGGSGTPGAEAMGNDVTFLRAFDTIGFAHRADVRLPSQNSECGALKVLVRSMRSSHRRNLARNSPIIQHHLSVVRIHLGRKRLHRWPRWLVHAC